MRAIAIGRSGVETVAGARPPNIVIARFRVHAPAGTMAFIWNAGGEGDLRELLAGIEAAREFLERDTLELETIGLPRVAAIVAEFAAEALPAAIALCPYVPEDRCNYENWMASYLRQNGRRS